MIYIFSMQYVSLKKVVLYATQKWKNWHYHVEWCVHNKLVIFTKQNIYIGEMHIWSREHMPFIQKKKLKMWKTCKQKFYVYISTF
jgi:hypothetical protein